MHTQARPTQAIIRATDQLAEGRSDGGASTAHRSTGRATLLGGGGARCAHAATRRGGDRQPHAETGGPLSRVSIAGMVVWPKSYSICTR